jgi:hypothetical protein
VTWQGLKRAASNLFWLPFRVVMVIAEWVFRAVVPVSTVIVAAFTLLSSYYYVFKSNQPMPIDPSFPHQPPEGMTFREFWRDRWSQFKKSDEYEYQTGRSKIKYGCQIFTVYFFPSYNVAAPIQRIYYVRFKPNSPMTKLAIRGIHGRIAPDDLNLVDALWWQFVNETWYHWVEIPLCDVPPPTRPAQAQP